MSKFFTTTQRVKIGPITATDHLGNTAPVENVVATSLDENILILVDDSENNDPTVLFVQSGGTAGTSTIRVVADALIGDGSIPISSDIEFTVTNPLAENLVIPIGTPEEIPTP